MATPKIPADRLRAVLVKHNGNREHAAAELCVTVQYVRSLIRRYQREHCTFPKNTMKAVQRFREPHIPTPEEIAERMQQVRRANGLLPIDEIRVAESIRSDMQ